MGVRENQLFDEFKERFKQIYFTNNPQTASYLGLHEYDGLVQDVSEDSIVKYMIMIGDLKNELLPIDKNELTSERKIDYDIAYWTLDSIEFRNNILEEHKTNPMYYTGMFWSIGNYIKRDYAPFEERLESLSKIFSNTEQIFENAKQLLQKKAPEIYKKYAIADAEGYIDFLQNTMPEVMAANNISESSINKFNETASAAIASFKSFIEFINNLETTSEDEYRLGEEKFLQMLEVTEHLKTDIETLRKEGEQELSRLQAEYDIIVKGNPELKNGILSSSHPTEDNLVHDTDNILGELVTFIKEKEIVDLPERLNCQVIEMPSYMNIGFAAMGTAGPYEKSDESFYYVKPPQSDWTHEKKEEWLSLFNYPTLKMISIHEAYPGHYTHFLNINRNASDLAKLFMSYSYVEGWAHYTEEMMLDEGYNPGDNSFKLAQIEEAMIRCCRYLVALEMHTGKMTIDEAAKFFEEKGHLNPTIAIQEAERGAFDPGYLCYTLGKFHMKKFKQDYFKKFPDRKLKDFHNNIVSIGCPTFKIAREHILN